MSNFLVNFPDCVLLRHGTFPILFQECVGNDYDLPPTHPIGLPFITQIHPKPSLLPPRHIPACMGIGYGLPLTHPMGFPFNLVIT